MTPKECMMVNAVLDAVHARSEKFEGRLFKMVGIPEKRQIEFTFVHAKMTDNNIRDIEERYAGVAAAWRIPDSGNNKLIVVMNVG